MNRTGMLLALLLISWPAAAGAEPQRSKARATKPAVELPKAFGIYSESPGGPVSLMENPTIPAKDPAFLIYLENAPPIERVRLRFGKSSAMMAIVDMKAGEDRGAFEAKLAPIAGRDGVYRAVYTGTLEPDAYIVYYLTDASEGASAWERAQFQFAGQFSVK